MLTPQKLIWWKTSFSKERDAFNRVAKEFTPGVDFDNNRLSQVAFKRAQIITLEHLEREYNKATPRTLSDSVWRRLDHTESFDTITPNDCQLAMARLNRTTADISVIIDEYNTGRIRAPIILQLGSNEYQLVAGNVRLMVARVGKIQPKVIIVRYGL
jgi:hypothetical protein